MPAAPFMLFGYQQVFYFVPSRSAAVQVAHQLRKIFPKLRKVETVALFFVLCECAKMCKLIARGKLKNACAGARKRLCKALRALLRIFCFTLNLRFFATLARFYGGAGLEYTTLITSP